MIVELSGIQDRSQAILELHIPALVELIPISPLLRARGLRMNALIDADTTVRHFYCRL
jgi:hypothetical protein